MTSSPSMALSQLKSPRQMRRVAGPLVAEPHEPLATARNRRAVSGETSWACSVSDAEPETSA